MLKKKEAFLKILALELDDLDEDIKLLIESYKEKREHDEITNYVFLHNLATMQSELFGVEGLADDIEDIDINEFDTLDNLVEHVKETLDHRLKHKGIVHSVMLLVERKINKILKYLEH